MSPLDHFDAETHEYTREGRPIVSCTNALNEAGLISFDHVAVELLERKSELGREVHTARHLYDTGRLGSHDPAVTPYLDAWITFRKQSGFVPVLSEHWQIAEVLGMAYGMRIDAAGVIYGRETIIDTKISEIYPHHAIQLAGYAAGLHSGLATHTARFRVRKRAVVQLRSDGTYRLKYFEDPYDLDVFIASLRIASWKREREK